MFPSGHPSKYWLGSTLLNFSDRTRTGVFSVIWPLASVRVTLKVFQLHVFTPREQIKKAEHQRLLKERSQKCSAFLLKRSRLVFKRVVAFLTPSQWSLRLKPTALVGQWIPPWTWPNKKGRTPEVLCLFLKRGTVSDTHSTKSQAQVSRPSWAVDSTLDLAK